MENLRLLSQPAYRKENQVKTQLNIYLFFNFIKSETSDSFVNHFDGHFAYLKTLDFYFKMALIAAYFNAFISHSGGDSVAIGIIYIYDLPPSPSPSSPTSIPPSPHSPRP